MCIHLFQQPILYQYCIINIAEKMTEFTPGDDQFEKNNIEILAYPFDFLARGPRNKIFHLSIYIPYHHIII